MISGTIYAIIDDDYFYIGSTTRSLELRIQQHICDSKIESKKYSKLYKYINEVRGGWDDILYIILEEVNCNTKYELEQKEYNYIKPHINDEFCLNILKNIKQKHIIYKNNKIYNK
jgi:hypothetical protein